MNRTSYIYNNSVFRAIELLRACEAAEVYLKSESDKKWVVTLPAGNSITFDPQDTASLWTQLGRAIQYLLFYICSPHFRATSERAFEKLEKAAPKVQAEASKVQIASQKVFPQSPPRVMERLQIEESFTQETPSEEPQIGDKDSESHHDDEAPDLSPPSPTEKPLVQKKQSNVISVTRVADVSKDNPISSSEEELSPYFKDLEKNARKKLIKAARKIHRDERKDLLDQLLLIAGAHSSEDWKVTPEVIKITAEISLDDRSDEVLSNVFRVLKLYANHGKLVKFLLRTHKPEKALEILCSLDPANKFSLVACEFILYKSKEIRQPLLEVTRLIQTQTGLNRDQFLKLLHSWSVLVEGLVTVSKDGWENYQFSMGEEISQMTFLLPLGFLPTAIKAAAEWKGASIDFFKIVMRPGTESREKILQNWSDTLKSKPTDMRQRLICDFIAENHHLLDIDTSCELYNQMQAAAVKIAEEDNQLTSLRKQIVDAMPPEDGVKLWTGIVPFLLVGQDIEVFKALKSLSQEERTDLLTRVLHYMQTINKAVNGWQMTPKVIAIAANAPASDRTDETLSIIYRVLCNYSETDKIMEAVDETSKEKIKATFEFLCALDPRHKFSQAAGLSLNKAPTGLHLRMLEIIPHIQAQNDLDKEGFLRLVTLWALLFKNELDLSKNDQNFSNLLESSLDPDDIQTVETIKIVLPAHILPTIITAVSQWKGDLTEFFSIVMKEGSNSRQEVLDAWIKTLRSSKDENTQFICLFIAENYDQWGLERSSQLYTEMVSAVTCMAADNAHLSAFREKLLQGLPQEEAARLWAEIAALLLIFTKEGLDSVERDLIDISQEEKAALLSSLTRYWRFLDEDLAGVVKNLKKIPQQERAEAFSLLRPYFPLIKDASTLICFMKTLSKIPQKDRSDTFTSAFSYIKSLYKTLVAHKNDHKEICEKIEATAKKLFPFIATLPAKERVDAIARVDRFFAEMKKLDDDSSYDGSDEENLALMQIDNWVPFLLFLGRIPKNQWDAFLETTKSKWSVDSLAITSMLPPQVWSKTSKALSQWTGDVDEFIPEIMEKDPVLREEILQGWCEALRADDLNAKPIYELVVEVAKYDEDLFIHPDSPLYKEMVLYPFRKASPLCTMVIEALPQKDREKIQTEITPFFSIVNEETLQKASSIMGNMPLKEQAELLAKIITRFEQIEESQTIIDLVQILAPMALEEREYVFSKAQTSLRRITPSNLAKAVEIITDLPKEEREDILSKVDQYFAEFDTRFSFSSWSRLVKSTGYISKAAREVFLEIVGSYLATTRFNEITSTLRLLPPTIWYLSRKAFNAFFDEDADKPFCKIEYTEIKFFKTLIEKNPELWEEITESWHDMFWTEETPQSEHIYAFIKTHHKELYLELEDSLPT